MEKEVFIYGSGGHSNVVIEVAERNGYKILGIFDDDDALAETGLSILPGILRTDTPDFFDNLADPVIVCIGDNPKRAGIVELLTHKNCRFLSVVDPTSVVSKSAKIGEGTVVLHRSIVQSNVTIGRHSIVNTASSVDHDCVVGDFAHVSPNAALCGYVRVGEGAHIGAGAVLIPKVKVGRWSIVGAGAVVIKDVPDNCTVVGNPARIVKSSFNDSDADFAARMARVRQLDEREFDVVFVGSGLSSSATIISLIDQLYTHPPRSAVRLCVCDSSGEFHKGIAYGQRSGRHSLTITSLLEFLPNDLTGRSAERNRFIRWLEANREWVLQEIESCGRFHSSDWQESTLNRIADSDWENLFLPRWLFGCYISERVTKKLDSAVADGLISYELVADTVVDLIPEDEGYWVENNRGSRLFGRAVVLGLGSPPTKDLLPRPSADLVDQICLVSDCFDPSIDKNLERVSQHIQSSNGGQAGGSIVVVGSNASAMEVLHHLKFKRGLYDAVGCIYTLSSSPGYPWANDIIESDSSYVPEHLQELYEQHKSKGRHSNLTADKIFDTARKDIDTNDLDIGLTLGPISRRVGALCDLLSDEEEKKFVYHTGTDLGRLQRRAGKDYMAAVASMLVDQKLVHVQGKFLGLTSIDGEVFIRYESSESSAQINSAFSVDVLIGCVGSETINSESKSPLLRNLLSRNLCDVNESGRGFIIHDDFSTSKRLYVTGPLLAGNVARVGEANKSERIWHTEHCGRILRFSATLAKNIAADLAAGTSPSLHSLPDSSEENREPINL